MLFRRAFRSARPLETYDGALLLVTYDRRMLQNVRLDRPWKVDGGPNAKRLSAVAQRGGQTAHREQYAALHQLVLIARTVPTQQLNL
ncbi:hypothetical protein CCUG60884_01787 [Mycobacteroides salmoniphilum]|uniref:Uncharacterized protein n=1 Tax=Mycobacteroides salmoniphilum TaxID=404941 RepID=A0A4R8SWC1_9MYCO|nr:hypothetical protein CCUG60884_01787 [Mycobacteroides salmoniphilum]